MPNISAYNKTCGSFVEKSTNCFMQNSTYYELKGMKTDLSDNF